MMGKVSIKLAIILAITLKTSHFPHDVIYKQTRSMNFIWIENEIFLSSTKILILPSMAILIKIYHDKNHSSTPELVFSFLIHIYNVLILFHRQHEFTLTFSAYFPRDAPFLRYRIHSFKQFFFSRLNTIECDTHVHTNKHEQLK